MSFNRKCIQRYVGRMLVNCYNQSITLQLLALRLPKSIGSSINNMRVCTTVSYNGCCMKKKKKIEKNSEKSRAANLAGVGWIHPPDNCCPFDKQI